MLAAGVFAAACLVACMLICIKQMTDDFLTGMLQVGVLVVPAAGLRAAMLEKPEPFLFILSAAVLFATAAAWIVFIAVHIARARRSVTGDSLLGLLEAAERMKEREAGILSAVKAALSTMAGAYLVLVLNGGL
jgi:hypothetical protein